MHEEQKRVIEPSITGSVLYEVKTYRFVVAGRTMANLEILCFDDCHYGAQGSIVSSDQQFSTGFAQTLEDALEAITRKTEELIKDDPWVIEIEQHRF